MAARETAWTPGSGALRTRMSRWRFPGTKVDICSHSHMFPASMSGGLTPMAIRQRNTPGRACGDSGGAGGTVMAGGCGGS